MRVFETGATRDADETKLDYEGFLSPLALERFAQYMTKHRVQADGQLRASDNWQKGIPLDAYMKSAWRHFVAWWQAHRDLNTPEELEESLCGLIFNAQGYLHEVLKAKLKVEITTDTLHYPNPLTLTHDQALDLDKPEPFTTHAQLTALDKLKLFLTGGVPSADTSGPKVP